MSEQRATRAAGRPRAPGTDRAILEATLALVRRGGPAAVTVEAVAAASGVAKTTIYRRHADRTALLRAALASAVGRPDDPPAGSARERLAWSAAAAWRHLEDVLGPGGVAAVLTGSDPVFAELFRAVLEPYDAALVRLVEEDVARGEVRAGVDPQVVVSLLVGAWLGELLRHGRIAPGWGERCVDTVWAALAP